LIGKEEGEKKRKKKDKINPRKYKRKERKESYHQKGPAHTVMHVKGVSF